VYELGIAKGGPKLKEADASVIPRMQVALGHFISTAEPISQLVRNLSQRLGRTVVDKTGLSGRYNFELIYNTAVTACDASNRPKWPVAIRGVRRATWPQIAVHERTGASAHHRLPRKTQRELASWLIESCENCNPLGAEIPFDNDTRSAHRVRSERQRLHSRRRGKVSKLPA
jgi:hypothetical protein